MLAYNIEVHDEDGLLSKLTPEQRDNLDYVDTYKNVGYGGHGQLLVSNDGFIFQNIGNTTVYRNIEI